MEKFPLETEQIEGPEESLRNFFESLPSQNENVYEIPRASIDALVERGVSVEKICQEFVQRGFLLHGTGVKGITKLEPRQAWCESGRPENCQNAVYSSDEPRIPLFMSIVTAVRSNNKSSGYNISVSFDEKGVATETATFYCSVPIPPDVEGVVYILPGENFRPAGGNQLVSFDTVSVAYAIPTRKEDFMYPIELADRSENK